MASDLLTPAELRAVENLQLKSQWVRAGSARGERVSAKKGTSIEFSDFREYSEGDDLRHLDWNVLARLETPVIRTYRDEEDLTVYLAVDTSASMDFGDPSKALVARRLAFLIGLAALNGGDHIRPQWLGAPGSPPAMLRGRGAATVLQQWLQSPPAVTRSLSSAIAALAQQTPRPGLCVLVTDGMDPDIESALRVLRGLRHEVWFVQVLSPEEMNPDVEGDLRLIDAESGAAVEVTANRDAVAAYEANFARHLASIDLAVTRMGGRSIRVTTQQPILDVVRNRLVREGWMST